MSSAPRSPPPPVPLFVLVPTTDKASSPSAPYVPSRSSARVPLQPYAATRSHAPWVRGKERAGAALGDGRQGCCKGAGLAVRWWNGSGLGVLLAGYVRLGAWAAELGGAGALGWVGGRGEVEGWWRTVEGEGWLVVWSLRLGLGDEVKTLLGREGGTEGGILGRVGMRSGYENRQGHGHGP